MKGASNGRKVSSVEKNKLFLLMRVFLRRKLYYFHPYELRLEIFIVSKCCIKNIIQVKSIQVLYYI